MKITEEMIKYAKSYIPITEKQEIARQIAKASIENLKVDDVNKGILPELVGENMGMKEMLLLQAFLGNYFDIKAEKYADTFYDEYNSDNVYNQLQRFKSNTELRDKCYDILDDFKLLKKMVSSEINNIKIVENDTLGRFMLSMSIGSDPETLKNALKDLSELKVSDND